MDTPGNGGAASPTIDVGQRDPGHCIEVYWTAHVTCPPDSPLPQLPVNVIEQTFYIKL